MTAALSPQTIRALHVDYWNDEASVNGVWLGLLANAYPGAQYFVIQPEGKALSTGSAQRNDLLVREIVDAARGKVIARLLFEGKSGTSSDSLDTAGGQIAKYIKAAGSKFVPSGGKVWVVVAHGSKFQAYLYSSTMELLSLGGAGGKPSVVKGGASKDLRDDGVVEVVEHFLAYARHNPQPVLA